ncbi:MAG: hypothetical protein ACRD3T_02885 [Terriglobia bacterium]
MLITQDAVTDVPTDIRHLEFIRYDLDRDVEFLSKLDNAIYHVFVERYSQLYEQAVKLLAKFSLETGSTCEQASPEDFQARVAAAENRGVDIPSTPAERLKEFLLPKIIKDVSEIAVIARLQDWLAPKDP